MRDTWHRRRFQSATAAGGVLIAALVLIFLFDPQGKGSGISVDEEKVESFPDVAAFPEDVIAAMNLSADPCEDFYEFACGGWEKANRALLEANEYKNSVNLGWDHAQKRSREQVLKLLAEDTGSAGIMYRSCMDVDRIEALGGKPLLPWLRLIDSISSKDDLVTVTAMLNKHQVNPLFSWWVAKDPRNSSRNMFAIAPPPLSLPDKTYYSETTKDMQKHRATFVLVTTRFFQMVGYTEVEAKERSERILRFETLVAAITPEKSEARRDHGSKIDWLQMDVWSAWWPWRSWISNLSSCDAPPDGTSSLCQHVHTSVRLLGTEQAAPHGTPLYIFGTSFFKEYDSILAREPLDTYKALLAAKMLSNAVIFLSSSFIDLEATLQGQLTGNSAMERRLPPLSPLSHNHTLGASIGASIKGKVYAGPNRKRKCYATTAKQTQWPMAKLYVDNFFRSSNRPAAVRMLDEIRTELMQALHHSQWMAQDDRNAAQAKLEQMLFQVAYPTNSIGESYWPKETTALDGMLGADLFTNYMLSVRLAVQRRLEYIDFPPSRTSWGLTPLDINSEYDVTSNSLFIPAAILQKPFFDTQQGDARNFGALGSILGHEIIHGFDDQGRHFDALGLLHDWWDKRTESEFAKHIGCIKDLYSGYRFAGDFVNGNLTIGENMADIGGLQIAYAALMARQRTKSADEHRDHRRLFFTAFAQTYCSSVRKKAAKQALKTDVHAPNRYRVIGSVSQSSAFADAFQCARGSAMSPASRCPLW